MATKIASHAARAARIPSAGVSRTVLPLLLCLGLHGQARATPPGPTPEGASPAPTAGSTPQSDISTASTAPSEAPAAEDWAFHAQTTLLEQYHPGFHAAYSGPNSLDPGSRGNETWDLTFYAGVRPWKDGELWINPEVDQGFGISNTVGLAAYTSAEAYKVGSSDPYVRVPRLFFRQTIDLGGPVGTVAPDLNQLGCAQSADRVVVTIGKFGVVDVFDTNKYAHDARNDFMNWAVVDAAAFDYAADAWGYTYGASVEWYQNWWALRAGAFDGSTVPNSKFLEPRFGAQFQMIAEAEGRYAVSGREGKVKLLGFATRAKLATFAELETFFAGHPGAGNAAVEAVRRLRNKFGGSINVEQAITNDLGFFLRASLSDGRTEAYEFTDADRSLSLGLSMAGTLWGRPDDTAGLAGVVDNISKARKNYLAQGGLGILVGDGKLPNAGPEQVVEAFYSLTVRKGVNLTADYQFVRNPAYNRDRGPVSVLGGRVHVQF